ncbi:hypothetical protein C7T94_04250 [Pedobacter yulinensis]|uniref:Uncharacterized protein n=1 Tax=Pedobacter yulinensis TaxID=2126353 RepID=A0A2T3HNJ7_9SPHI|nr:hypothetical protein C7T94_04250 [Pedobacter yulinensis]
MNFILRKERVRLPQHTISWAFVAALAVRACLKAGPSLVCRSSHLFGHASALTGEDNHLPSLRHRYRPCAGRTPCTGAFTWRTAYEKRRKHSYLAARK